MPAPYRWTGCRCHENSCYSLVGSRCSWPALSPTYPSRIYHPCRPADRFRPGTFRPGSWCTSWPLICPSRFQPDMPRTFQRRAWSREGTRYRLVDLSQRPFLRGTSCNRELLQLLKKFRKNTPDNRSRTIHGQRQYRAVQGDTGHTCHSKMPQTQNCISPFCSSHTQGSVCSHRTCHTFPLGIVKSTHERAGSTTCQLRR